MNLPKHTNLRDWAARDSIEAVAQYFVRRIDVVDLVALAAEPLTVLQGYAGLRVRIEDRSDQPCGVHGRYDANPPTIYLERSNWGRDNFTVLHEYGHHLQQHDLGWVDVLWRLSTIHLGWVEEQVSNRFASLVLIPDEDIVTLLNPGAITAKNISALHRQHAASAQAMLVRLEAAAYGQEPVFIALADVDGTIVFAISLHPDMPHPPFRSVQPDVARLAEEARRSDFSATGTASFGITYSTGNSRSDLRLDVAVGASGLVFVTGRPEHRYGPAQWARQRIECPAPACGEVFVWDLTVRVCRRCQAPKCPECSACSCEDTITTCQKCNLALTPADIATGRTQHDECW